MIPYLQDPDCTLYHGDVLDVLRELPDESVDCAATSPPFYGLRDYGTGRWEGGDEECDHRPVPLTHEGGRQGNAFGTPPGANRERRKEYGPTCGKCGARRIDQQIGLESTPEEWRDRLVEVFRELRRVLVPTGTLWVECGDSYNSQASNDWSKWKGGQTVVHGRHVARTVDTMKPKDLIGSPFLLAFGLRDDGWWWRSTSIWAKPNALPESVTDRPVVSHSYVFQFSKKARYFHDAEAVREPAEYGRRDGGNAMYSRLRNGDPHDSRNTPPVTQSGGDESGRSLRSVWQIPTQGFPEAHFATWPTKLAERILLMACPESVCRVCGKARERVVEKSGGTTGRSWHDHSHDQDGQSGALKTTRLNAPDYKVTTLGFTDCDCSSRDDGNEQTEVRRSSFASSADSKYRPGIVLDPFVGSGTTCFVARKLGRRSVGIDLSAEYLDLAGRRLQQQSLFAVTD